MYLTFDPAKTPGDCISHTDKKKCEKHRAFNFTSFAISEV